MAKADCGLVIECSKAEFGGVFGNNEAAVAVVLGHPMFQDMCSHQNLGGGDSKWLRACLGYAKLLPFQGAGFALMYAVRCFPGFNRRPKADTIDRCSQLMRQQLLGMPNLSVVVAIGSVALRGVLSSGVRLETGKAYPLVLEGKVAVTLWPMQDPASIEYRIENKDKVLQQFRSLGVFIESRRSGWQS
jgi:uracil-DNA glycosylase